MQDLSEEAIKAHWAQNPSHEVGAVIDDHQIVLDADSPEADEALRRLEERFNAVPRLIIKTRRGHHHHFRLEKGTFAKGDSHFTQEFPDRLDVRANRNSVMLTPSEGKTVLKIEANHCDGLSCVGQDFIDAVFQHNGREAPRPAPDQPEAKSATSTDATKLAALLQSIDPNCGYQDWLNVLMGIYHETGGSAEGFELADSWSRRGESYQGRKDIEVKWRSFRGDVANPITIATLLALARKAGADTASIMEETFDLCETTVIQPDAAPQDTTTPRTKVNPLTRHSLIGQTAKYVALAQDTTPLLGDVCQRGEATVWYARHNTGKTLLLLHMASEAIEKGLLAAEDFIFINADDSSSGIAGKLAILDELGAHTLVPGQNGFKPESLQALLLKAVENDTAHGTVVAIDTLKKFVDLMHKKQASQFAHAVRQHVTAGGTLLQHACEMLLKAVLVQKKAPVFDKATGRSIGFEKCLGLCQASHGLTADEAGIMRAIDALRDAAQHWFVFVSEDILYLQTRALITSFDDYLKRLLDDALGFVDKG